MPPGLASFPFARRYLGNHYLFSLPAGTYMFQFPACPPVRLWIHLTVTGSSPAGFPHSDVNGSMPACGSPLLFAACHVLRRRMVPGHPPCALCSLIFSSLILRPIVFFYPGLPLPFRFASSLQLAFLNLLSFLLCGCQGADSTEP